MSQRFLTIEQRLAQVDGRPSGFDYLRLFLALSVICFHSIVTSYGNDFQLSVYAGHWRCIWALILPMFFSLSGFLVAGSLERSKSMITFLGLRAIRIVPALAGEVILSALVLGPIVTNMSWSRYFSSYEFLQYFLNILGDIHYKLPGVFQNNPLPELVNGQLWTVPFELACYGILTLIAVLGVFKNRRLLLFLVIGLYCLQTAKMLYEHQLHTDDHFIVAALKGRVLEMTFVCGIFLYRFREKVPFRLTLFLASFVASLALLYFPPDGDRFAALPIAYMTIYLGLLNPPRQRICLSGDYSYGLFLYGFPVQQTLVYASPIFRDWWMNILSAIPITALISVSSWWVLEKPALELRRYLKKFESHYLRHKQRLIQQTRRLRGSLRSYRPHPPGDSKS